MPTQLATILANFPGFSPLIRSSKPFKKLDFSADYGKLLQTTFSDTADFTAFVLQEMLKGNAYIGAGGYLENRIIYRQLKHFVQDGTSPRSIHLGVDLWTVAGEPIYAPLAGKVHSFAFNNQLGDYGPTIILEHHLAEMRFYTLYGHLSLNSLDELSKGKIFAAGEKIGEIGPYPENGNWPPHLHFQIIQDIQSYQGDYPGVCAPADLEFYRIACPDPNLILRIAELNPIT